MVRSSISTITSISNSLSDKHAIGEYAKATGAFKSVVIVSPGWYCENFSIPDMAPIFGGFPFTPSEDGTLVFRAPKWGGKEDVPFIAIGDDYGDIVHGILLEPEKYNGNLVQGVSDVRSLDDTTKAFEKGELAQLSIFVTLIIDVFHSYWKESSIRGDYQMAGS